MAKRRQGVPKGVHIVCKYLKSGKPVFHSYAWRGGPKFWESQNYHCQNDHGYRLKYEQVVEAQSSYRSTEFSETTLWLVNEYKLSPEFEEKAKRSQEDYEAWLDKFADEFGEEPYMMFSEWESRAEVQEWRQKWRHSLKQYDYAGTVVTLFLNWAVDEAGLIPQHFCHRFKKYYKAERNEIIWTKADIQLFCSVAPVWVQDILIAACETGLRADDLVQLSIDHIDKKDPNRLTVLTQKRDRTVYIPITPTLRKLFDKVPKDKKYLLAAGKGGPLSARWASENIKIWRRAAGVVKSPDGREKTLNDTRGTAATRLLQADLSLNDIASIMGWSLRYAANVIEHYASSSPGETQTVLDKLAAAKSKENPDQL